MAASTRSTVAERIRLRFDKLTRSERKLANTLLSNYPVAGLTSMSEFARAAKVSAPTVLRTAQKLGFSGFPEFQEELRAELAAQLSTPLAKHDQWAEHAPETHILNRFTAAVIDNLHRSLMLMDHREFDRIVEIMADEKRGLHLIGGRLSHALADYLHSHLQAVRPGVTLMPGLASLWPQHLVNMKPGDVLVVFDVRRYERDLVELAALCSRRGVVVVLFTDQWMSPIAAVARHALPLRIEVPSSWDSAVVPLIMIEALLAAIVEALWPTARERMAALETLFDEMKRFRKSP